ncbi:MAG TPA: T9SS type A sorting domain-containing protein [Tangfeifania sp.]|nr:T9SS type A sorting domain-containing protein [Tangfeifania sp.]
MKTMKATLLITVLALISSTVFATGNLKSNMSQIETDKAVVAATNMKFDLFEIEVKDVFGQTLFSKTTEAKADYKRTYDFSALEDGVYFLNVNHGNEYYTKRFQLESGEVTVLEERKVVEPYFVQKGHKVKMSYLNFPNDDMSIYVYDDSGLLHEEELKNEFAVHKSIDMSELRSGEYRIVFSSGYEIFEKDITIE